MIGCCGEAVMNNKIVALKKSQIEQATEILASAFAGDPILCFLTAEARKWLCSIALRYSQPFNHVYKTANDLKGIAAWIPPGYFPLSWLRLLQVGAYAIPFQLGWSSTKQFMSLLSTLDKFHERDLPIAHWYLFMLGVAPAYQGQGIGSALIQPILQQADVQGLPCYLETSTSEAVRFYQKHRFEVLRVVELPGDS